MLTVDGLPLHPLIVHAVVVLLPLAALGGLAISLRRSWRIRYGWPVLLVAVVAVACVPVAQRSGQELAAKLPGSPRVEAHADLGGTLLWYALPFLITLLVLITAGRIADHDHSTLWKRIALLAAALTVFLGAATIFQVIRIGHSGATAVWGG
ncbi:hypothetical protein D5S17_18265 [Pseudonocardiaceae bacterium YIM PH 21723]|nr:hypothetical protein D5S17_18265 [Pseudonocardiaceae bacterium YIM PH 21723]